MRACISKIHAKNYTWETRFWIHFCKFYIVKVRGLATPCDDIERGFILSWLTCVQILHVILDRHWFLFSPRSDDIFIIYALVSRRWDKFGVGRMCLWHISQTPLESKSPTFPSTEWIDCEVSERETEKENERDRGIEERDGRQGEKERKKKGRDREWMKGVKINLVPIFNRQCVFSCSQLFRSEFLYFLSQFSKCWYLKNITQVF